MDGLANCSVYLLLAPRFDLVSARLGFAHDTLRLVAEFLRHLLVAALHFFVGHIELGISRSVGSDFRGFGTAEALLVQVLFDLLPAWTAGFQIFLGVALDLRRSRLGLAQSHSPVVSSRSASSVRYTAVAILL